MSQPVYRVATGVAGSRLSGRELRGVAGAAQHAATGAKRSCSHPCWAGDEGLRYAL